MQFLKLTQVQISIFIIIEAKSQGNRFEGVIIEVNALRSSPTIATTTLKYANHVACSPLSMEP